MFPFICFCFDHYMNENINGKIVCMIVFKNIIETITTANNKTCQNVFGQPKPKSTYVEKSEGKKLNWIYWSK